MSDQDDTDMRMLLRTAGLSLPAERLPVMLESYRRWMEIARALDEPLAYTDEPAVTFHPEPGVR
jgi:hypothetical protein